MYLRYCMIGSVGSMASDYRIRRIRSDRLTIPASNFAK